MAQFYKTGVISGNSFGLQIARLSSSYEPALERMPDAWTVTVKVNDTGDNAHLFGGLGDLAFDSRGYAWITNNVNQGTNALRQPRTLKRG